MKYQEFEKLFDTTNELGFKLYSLEYVIKKTNSGVELYAVFYPESKKNYQSLKDAMNNYKIYNETLMNNISKVEVICKE